MAYRYRLPLYLILCTLQLVATGINLLESTPGSPVLLYLQPVTFLGLLAAIPAVLRAARQDHQTRTEDEELARQRSMLEEQVTTRTLELRAEIERRNRMEAFNASRNHLLERVAEGKAVEEVLVQLAYVTENSIPDSRCLLALRNRTNRVPIAPSVPTDLAMSFEASLLSILSDASAGDGWEQHEVVFTASDPAARERFSAAWRLGFHRLCAVPVTEPPRPPLGVLALLLRENEDPGGFAREVLLSSSRLAAITLKHDRMQDELFRRAHYDPLTELPNRILFEDRLEQAIARAGRHRRNLGMLCIDLDGFKQVNDAYGHQGGGPAAERSSPAADSPSACHGHGGPHRRRRIHCRAG